MYINQFHDDTMRGLCNPRRQLKSDYFSFSFPPSPYRCNINLNEKKTS